MRAQHKVIMYVVLALRAEGQFLKVLQQILLLQGALKRRVKRFLGPED